MFILATTRLRHSAFPKCFKMSTIYKDSNLAASGPSATSQNKDDLRRLTFTWRGVEFNGRVRGPCIYGKVKVVMYKNRWQRI